MAVVPARKAGGNTSSIEVSPAKRRRLAKARRKQEAEWRSRNGPVVVTRKSEQ